MLRIVEKVTQKMNKNDEVLSKMLSTVLSKNQLEYLNVKHPQLDKRSGSDKEHQKLPIANSKYQTDEIQKPIFQNPAVEKYLNESMKKTLKRYKR